MNSKYESEFVNSFVCRDEPKYDWIVAKLHIKTSEFKDFIKKYESHIEENNGFLSIDVLRAQKDPSKMYAKFTKINKQAGQQEVKKVAMAEFMPDREATKEDDKDDLPF